MSSIALISLLALLGAQLVAADNCIDQFGRQYYCNYNGLSWGARVGIGLGVAAGVILLFALIAYWRRRQIRKQFAKYRPPALPFVNNNNNANAASNPFANNPPPPSSGVYGQNHWSNNQYGANPTPPQSTYQPSMAGQYGRYGNRDKPADSNGEDHEHGYEWQQARDQERMEREQRMNDTAPPGYDVSAQKTGTTAYAPPTGPPPTK